MDDDSSLNPMQEARLRKAVNLTIAQIQEARRIQETESGVSSNEETTLALTQILATNYLSIVRTAKQ